MNAVPSFPNDARRDLLIVLALWALVAIVSIWLHGPMPLYSTRTLGVAWEMWLRGDELVPYLNGEPYSHKAPLLYWLIHLGWAAGGVGMGWPRILMAAISTALLAATAQLGVAFFPQRYAPRRYAPWILAGCAYLFLFSLQIMFEVLLALCVAATLLAIAPALRSGGRPRWWLAGLAIGAGLLTKGPVMLLHVAFPLLLGPWWSEQARADRWRWYRGALGAVALGIVMLAAWLVPALLLGGDQYRNELLWKQTTGRMVESFDHARPLWWYLAILPVLGFPWIWWPTLWKRIAARPKIADPAVRLLIAWGVPTLVAFCLVSGKQVYYLLPLLPVAALGLTRAFEDPAVLERPRVPYSLLPFALLLIGLGAVLMALPHWIAGGHGVDRWAGEFAQAPWPYDALLIVLGLWLAWPSRAGGVALVPRLGAAVLLAVAVGHAIFTQALWIYFDVTPPARVIAREQSAGHEVATTYKYEGEYHFPGRLRAPLTQLNDAQAAGWATAHPDGALVTRPGRHALRPNAEPLFDAEFRERRVQIWRARDWLEAEGVMPKP